MPAPQTHLSLAHPVPRRTSSTTSILSLDLTALKSPYAFVPRSMDESEYAAPPPPPPSPVNFPGESWARR